MVSLFPRPRRFGKTLNLSTIRHFLEVGRGKRAALFHGLTVWDDEDARQHFARYPVIDLTFKAQKGRTWAEAFVGIRRLIAELCQEHLALLTMPVSVPSTGAPSSAP